MLPQNPDDQARLFYFLILALALMGGLFYQYRGRMGAALQHAAIWVLIFLGAVLVVGFWQPLMNQLQPGRATVQQSGNIVLYRASDGHFYANVGVNGQTVHFMVDTGASAVVLSKSDAARVGIDLGSLSFSTPVSTANGVADAALVRLKSVTFGGKTAHDVPAMVNGGQGPGSLLGMSYLDRFTSVQIKGDQLILQR